MKRSSPGLILAILWLLSSPALAQRKEARETITKEFALSGDLSRQVLAVYNIFGPVRVEGYAGSKVLLEATKTVRSDNATGLEAGRKQVQLGFTQRNDSVVVYVSAPRDSRPRRNFNWNSDDFDYSFSYDFVLKVPYAINLHASTVNGADVEVQDVAGTLDVRNVNGGISIKNAKGTTKAHTVNGSVDVTYAANPPGPSSYKTINGRITVAYPKDMGGDVHFKSMHGELYTNFPQVQMMPRQVTQTQQKDGKGTKYKLSKDTALRLGKGGSDLRFETLNGDVTIKQQL
ncbi:hypothetical protein GCM10023185_13520 [Hymenobacter saemangeumensis]|uniref:Adhesin domain-containing protein n=1 Tax=Hymenobacter saemangeumensis TaxID=1084522 RepID=A0ABP8I7T0_9BACT